MSEVIRMTVQLYDIKTRRDGGGRVQFEFGADAMHAIAQLMALNASGDTNLAIALVPYSNEQTAKHNDESVDPETGEIIMHRDHLD